MKRHLTAVGPFSHNKSHIDNLRRKCEFYSRQELTLGEMGQYLLFNKKRAKTKCKVINAHTPWRMYSQKKIFIVFKKEA